MKNLLLLFAILSLPLGLLAQNVQLNSLYGGFNNPLDITHAGDDRLFVVEQSGRIKIIDADGAILPTPFLNLFNAISSGNGEQGLLGLAFHPDYAENGFFYVNYTYNPPGSFDLKTRISRFSVNEGIPDLAVMSSEVVLMEFDQPFSNHNGGCLRFGADGYLYIGTGDGGSGGDPLGAGQDRLTLLGKMLRIDVTTNPDEYTIPADNPFANEDFTLDEIWTLGLRNPWRYSFDRLTGDLWIGDVGQNAREEIHFQSSNNPGGENYGWNCREGLIAYSNPSSDCNGVTDFTDPVFDYPSGGSAGCSVTGGVVYRGCQFPDLYGQYVFSDFCSGRFWTIYRDDVGGDWVSEEVLDTNLPISSFGEGVDGELYVTSFSGEVLRVETDAPFTAMLTADDADLSLAVNYTPDAIQWLLDGEPITGANTAEYTALETGVYSVEMRLHDCTYLSNETMVTVTNLVDIEGVNQLSVFPSPFQHQLAAHLEMSNAADVEFSLMTPDGKIIHTVQRHQISTANTILETAALPVGVYLLKITINGETVVRKVVKY